MLKRIIKKILYNKPVAKLLIKPVLKLHTLSYNLAGNFAVILNKGLHPKHRIIKYKQWFLDNIEKDWVVLDIGCNTGLLPALLAQKASFVYGIELSQNHIDIAKSKNNQPNIQYICADATTYDYTNCKPVNCVTLSNVLEHIKDRSEFLKKIIIQIKWADPDNKCLLFRVPTIEREWIIPYKKELKVEYRLDATHHIEYTLDEFKNELSHVGIEITDLQLRFGEIYALAKAK